MTINYVAILSAAVAAFVFGAVWYGALGKQWLAALGDSARLDGPRKLPVGPMITSFIAELLMATMMAGLIGHFGAVTIKTGLIVGGLCWLGFIATTVTVNNAYPGRSLMLTIIDCAHWLGVTLIIGLVLGAFG